MRGEKSQFFSCLGAKPGRKRGKMKPTPSHQSQQQGDLFKTEVSSLVPSDHPLRLLGDKIDWTTLQQKLSSHYHPTQGRPGCSVRMLCGLLFLKQMYDLSDVQTCQRLAETPAWQYFCGIRYFSQASLCDASTLCRFRLIIGKEGFEMLFGESVRLGKQVGLVKKRRYKPSR